MICRENKWGNATLKRETDANKDLLFKAAYYALEEHRFKCICKSKSHTNINCKTFPDY